MKTPGERIAEALSILRDARASAERHAEDEVERQGTERIRYPVMTGSLLAEIQAAVNVLEGRPAWWHREVSDAAE